MAHSSNYCITSEIFIVPVEDMLILYAPLKGVVARINESTAALLRDLQLGISFELTSEETQVLQPLENVGIVNGPPDLYLTVHEYGEFAPTHVTLFLTNACNLRCIYCYAHGGENSKPALIPLEAARAGIDFVADNALRKDDKAFSVGFHGAGEPTIAWDIYRELIDYAHLKGEEMGLMVSCSTCTNGVMPEEHARWLAEHNNTATISVDGLPYYHNLQRPKSNGKGSFADVQRTLEIFDEMGFFYGIRATITKYNVHTMGEMMEFLDDHFKVGDLQFDPLIYSGRCHDTGCEPPSDDVYIKEFIRAYEIARRRNRLVGFSCLSFTSLKTFYCCAVSDGFTITHDGYVTACFEVFGTDHPYADKFMYGRYDFDKHDFDLNLDILKKLQKRHVYNLPFCQDCFCRYMCAGDCPIHSLKMGHNMERGTRCEITQAVAKHRLATIVKESMPNAIVKF
jgi:uncharacterized protein